MTEPTPEAVTPPELPLTFWGREIYVRMPRPEQILVWQRTVTMLTKLEDNQASWTGSEVMAALERCRKIIDSILVNKVDVTWMDDQFLDGELEFKDLMPFLTQVLNTFTEAAENEAPNRETKRAVRKKAARKKANA